MMKPAPLIAILLGVTTALHAHAEPPLEWQQKTEVECINIRDKVTRVRVAALDIGTVISVMSDSKLIAREKAHTIRYGKDQIYYESKELALTVDGSRNIGWWATLESRNSPLPEGPLSCGVLVW